MLNCPHCGQSTRLTRGIAPVEVEMAADAPTGPAVGKPAGSARNTIIIACVLVVAAGAAILVWPRLHHQTIPPEIDAAQAAREKTSPAEKTPPSAVSSSNAEPPAVNREKSLDDLKVGSIAIERTPGTKIIYATGTLTNDSTFQRFGVTVELDVLDRNGQKLGAARDYKNIIEPHQSWKFRAMVIEAKAKAARVSSVNEQK